MTPTRKGPAAATTGHTLTSGFSNSKCNREQRQADLSTLRQIAQRFGGEVRGNSVFFPTPGHSAKDRGSAATLMPDAPDGILVHSFNGGDPIAIKVKLRNAGILPQWRADSRSWRRFDRRRNDLHKRVAAPVVVRAPVDGRMQRRAFQLWHEARAPVGTPAEQYLAQEGITQLPDDAARFLRFHPACPFRAETHPAMLVLVRSIATGEPQAIERTALAGDCTRGERMTLGPKTSGVVMVSPDDAIETGLALCEGVKDALALLQAGLWWPVWATLGTSGLASFPVLNGIEALRIYADNDDAGVQAAKTLRRRWREAGRHVEALQPVTSGYDPADALAGKVVAA